MLHPPLQVLCGEDDDGDGDGDVVELVEDGG